MAGRRNAARRADATTESASSHDIATLVARIHEASSEAMTGLPPAKVADLVGKWSCKAEFDLDNPDDAWFVAQAMGLAGLVILFTPSLTGASPLDRFIRDRRAAADGETRAALDGLARAEFHLLRVLSRASQECFLVEDLANGETLRLLDGDWPDRILQLEIAAWLAPLPSGDRLAVGPVLPLDQPARDEGLSFVRPGKGLVNPRRCAAAVYRHVVRHGGLLIEGVNTLAEDDIPDDLADEGEPFDALHSVAEEFARTAQGQAPAEAIREVRSYASVAYLVESMGRSAVMRRLGRALLAEAYSRIAYIVLETLDRRIAAGYMKELPSFEEMATLIDRSIAEGNAPNEIHDMFEDLRRRVVATRSAKRSGDDKELARVLQLIRALRAKTVDQGCSEQEAIASAKKVAELLDRYGLSLGEIELREQSCEGIGIDTGRKRRAPIDECVTAVADFCDCRVWHEKTPSGVIRFVFFGLPADVAAAHCVHDLIVLAFATETAAFKKSNVSGPKPSAHSFQIGLAHGIAMKLRAMKAERDAANCASGGRALVPIKASVVEDEMERLGLSFYDKSVSRSRKVDADAYDAGVVAGHKFEPFRGVESA
ncbi:MAG TPA: DUF2786 domain-containing protein [Methylosinus sp.]|jgi:hypothetical protein